MGDHLQRVGLRSIHGVAGGEIFRECNIVPGEISYDRMLILLFDLERITLAKDFEIFDGVGRRQLKMDIHLARGESVINIGPQRNGEERPEILDENALVVFNLHTLGAMRGDGEDARAECGRVARLVCAALTLLQKAGIYPLSRKLVVNLFSTLTFQYHSGNSRKTIPHREVGDRGTAGKRKNVIPFLDAAGVVGKDLADEDARIA